MSSTVHWYPGHIAKVERQLDELLKLVDVVVVALDARIPVSTVNPRLQKRIRNKPTMVLLNKSDLSDPRQNQRWLTRLKKEVPAVMLFDTKGAKRQKVLVQEIIKLGEEKMRSLEAKGMKRRPIRVLICGMPNVGKSSIINSIVGKKKAVTGHKAGVTRQSQWVRIHPAVELLDTPGIIPPKLDSQETGYLLAAVSSVSDATFHEEEVSAFLLQRIEALYPVALRTYYGIAAESPVTLETIAEVRHYRSSGGGVDVQRAAQAVLHDFRHARFGPLTLEQVETPEETSDSAEKASEATDPASL